VGQSASPWNRARQLLLAVRAAAKKAAVAEKAAAEKAAGEKKDG
jgi:hypothetical protein